MEAQINNCQSQNQGFLKYWEKFSTTKRSVIIIQIFGLMIYLLAYVAYIGETGHFNLTPQLLFWLLGTMLWVIGHFAINEKQLYWNKTVTYLSASMFIIADLLILLFIIGMIDFSITSRGYRRILGMVIPLNEAPATIKTETEVFKKNQIGKTLRFFQKAGKNWVEITLKYRPLPETVNLWEGVLNFPPDNFILGTGSLLLSETNYSEDRFTANPENQYSVRYSYDTRENRRVFDFSVY